MLTLQIQYVLSSSLLWRISLRHRCTRVENLRGVAQIFDKTHSGVKALRTKSLIFGFIVFLLTSYSKISPAGMGVQILQTLLYFLLSSKAFWLICFVVWTKFIFYDCNLSEGVKKWTSKTKIWIQNLILQVLKQRNLTWKFQLF